MILVKRTRLAQILAFWYLQSCERARIQPCLQATFPLPPFLPYQILNLKSLGTRGWLLRCGIAALSV
jgi:hypothetical protein